MAPFIQRCDQYIENEKDLENLDDSEEDKFYCMH